MRPVTSVVKEIAMTLTYRTVMVDGLKVFYRTAGDVKKPAVLLLHGFPTSSHMFRELIPALADRYYLVAPCPALAIPMHRTGRLLNTASNIWLM